MLTASLRRSAFSWPGNLRQVVTPDIVRETRWLRSPYDGLDHTETKIVEDLVVNAVCFISVFSFIPFYFQISYYRYNHQDIEIVT